MSDAVAVLSALDRPAALMGADGERLGANAAFNALPAALRARALSPLPPPGWRTRDLPGGQRLVLGAASAEDDRLLARERFLATLSHEIRTPLNGVLGMAGLLHGTRLDATQHNYLDALKDSAEHLLSLVNDVLNFAKLDSGKVELEPAPTDIERLLQGVCELLSPRAHESGLEIAWGVERGLPPVMADDGRLRQILFNLAGNAVKMTPAGGVLVTAERRNNPREGEALRLRFCVRDTGPGLEPEAQARIFEEFVQTEAGARAGGAGLGLAIVKRLAEAFDGTVGLDSKPGAGARFWFEAEFHPAGTPEGGRELGGLTVGVVSASSIVREAAARQVVACGGRALTFATAAEAAGQALALMLIDPDDKGRRLTAPPKTLPALVLLAPEARGKINRYRAAGYAGYLIKPLRRASLAARVRAALDQTPDLPVAAPAAGVGEDERAAPLGSCRARVLLAEDNAVNALLARALLEREGCSVDRVANGEEAIAAVAAAPYDIVLMDVRMPVMDGLTATRALRAQGFRTPVVAMTADAFDDDRRACLEAGMNDFLSKPIDMAALRAALARWTGREEEAKLAS